MNFIKKISKPFISFVLKLNARKTISLLRNDSDPDLKMLGDILKESLENSLTLEEKIWIDKIESLRKELVSSDEPLVLTEYGRTNTIGEKSKACSELYFWVLVLFKIIRKFKPLSCIELGACVGLSASFQASALHLNGKGKMVTLEGLDPVAGIAEKNFKSLGLNNIDVVVGKFDDTLNTVLNKIGSIDYAFIDGHLQKDPTLNYFNQFIPFCKDKAILIIDNISWSQGMEEAWKIIRADERVKISLDLRHLGICIIGSERSEKQSFRIPLY